jgi:class 3 adenylate cyclase/predicted ATPase
MTELSEWLSKLGLEKYTQVLIDNDVDLEVLQHLSDDDLKELGFSLGHRRKLLASLRDSENKGQAEGASPVSAQVPEKADEAERRQLTVMFCDLVGSTELSERLDPEELRSLLGSFHEAVTGSITAHGGYVAKLLGDGVLAYFGWPTAHENDAERAVHAGLAATESVAGLESHGKPLAVRTGIATGPVVIGDMHGKTAHETGSIAGATPNLAARLQGVARPGEIVIHESTKRLVRGTFELEPLGRQILKGFSEPVAIWRVIGSTRTGSRFEALRQGSLTDFVGRTHEIELMVDRWRLAQDGEGQVVLLCGEAGIGKSRVLREFISRLEDEAGMQVTYQCSPHETNAAFQPVIAEIEQTSGFQPGDDIQTRLNKLEQHLASCFDNTLADEEMALFAGLLGLPTESYPAIEMAPLRRKQRTIELLTDRLIALANQRALLLTVEDIHWVDPSTLEVLDAVIPRIQNQSVLAVLTYRPEFQPAWGSYEHVTTCSLNRLGRADGRMIAERVAGGKALPDEVLARIIAQTDGTPLFVEEVTKSVLESGILEEQGDRYVLRGPLPPFAIPETLQDSLMARLDRLAPVKRVVQAAACIGREFGTELLAAALPMDDTELDTALNELVAAELIFPIGSKADEARFIFKHALVQDAAYASLVTATRCSLHERLALALEKTPDPDPLELGRHFLESNHLDRAARLYLEAGKNALEASALPEAIGALEIGLRAANGVNSSVDRDGLELDIRVALGTARMASFGWAHPSVSEAMEPAFQLAEATSNYDALGSILWALWVHYQTRTDFPRAHEWLAQLKSLASEKPQSDLPIIYDMSAGCQYFWEADYTRALDHTDRLKSAYEPEKHARITRLTNHDPLVFAQHWAGSLADWIAGRPDSSVERLDEAINLARQIGHPFNLVFALTAGATALIYLNQTKSLLDCCDEAALVTEREALGPFSENVNVMQWRGAAYVVEGEFERGYNLLKQGNEFWTNSGGRICTAMFRSWIVLGLVGLDRIEEAANLNTDNIQHCRLTGDCYMEPECLRLAGELALRARTPNVEAAQNYFNEAIALARSHEAKSWELRSALSLARLLQSQNSRNEAIAVLEPVFESFTQGFGTEDLQEAKTLLTSLH